MNQVRQIQLIAILLILVAGALWSQRLADQSFQAGLKEIDSSNADQLEIVRQKVAEQESPLTLVDFGRKFLDAGNPRFAIIPLERATDLKHNYRDAWFLLGYSYAQLFQKSTDPAEKTQAIDRAKAALQKAHQLDPTHQLTNDLLTQLTSN